MTGAPDAANACMRNPMVHWEIMAGDVERAKAFYGRVFGWQFSSYGPEYTMIDTGGVPAGGLMKRPPSAVATIDQTLRQVVEAGGNVVVPRTEIPPGWFAMFLDPEGIPIGILETRTKTA